MRKAVEDAMRPMLLEASKRADALEQDDYIG